MVAISSPQGEQFPTHRTNKMKRDERWGNRKSQGSAVRRPDVCQHGLDMVGYRWRALVCIVQPDFALLEAGSVRVKNTKTFCSSAPKSAQIRCDQDRILGDLCSASSAVRSIRSSMRSVSRAPCLCLYEASYDLYEGPYDLDKCRDRDMSTCQFKNF